MTEFNDTNSSQNCCDGAQSNQAQGSCNGSFNPNSIPPKTWLVESILVTVLCCLPFGIVGIVNAAQVQSYIDRGDLNMARVASERAKKWTKIGFFTSLIVGAIYIIFLIFSLVFAAAIA